MKPQLLFTILSITIFSLVFANSAQAACPSSLTNGGLDGTGFTLTNNPCVVPADTVYVVDNGLTESSTTNNAVITLSGSTLTISAGAILNAGSVVIGTGSIVLQGTTNNRSRLELGPRWVGGETDADGYTDSLTTLYTATAAGRRRLGLMKSKTTIDCNGAAVGYNYTLPSTYYVDADQDAFTISSQAGVTGICSNQSTWDAATSTTVPGAAIGTATSFNAGTRRAAASGITDCDDAQATVKYPHTACFWNLDGDAYTNGNSSGKTCLSHSTCATSTSASLGGGVAPTAYTAGRITDAASGTDCNDALSGHNFTLAATYYPDADLDTYTLTGVSAGTGVCATASTWNASTASSVPGVGSTAATFSAGARKAAASATADCLDSDANIRTKNATGGTITNITGYRVHSFTASGTFTITCGGTTSVEYIVVAGGGSGGSSKVSWGGGGGGGAGGYLSGTTSATQGTGYSATVGAGGVARAVSSNLAGANGGNSVFSSFTAIGGGGGGFGGGPGQSVAVAGGSGGGAGYSPDFGPYWCYAGGAAGTAGQGNAGAGVPSCDGAGGAGGGGAGSVGGFRTGGSSGGAGGAGIASSITGSSITRAAGGKGGDSAILPLTGAANTGNAGGGAYAQNAASGAGGSGIVIVRYANP